MAVSCCQRPAGTLTFAGVTARDASTGEVTVSLAATLIAPITAVIVVVPLLTLDANPEALMVATAGADEVHVTLFVRFLVLASV